MTEYPELHPCADCSRMTRPKNRKAEEYPITTYARGNGDLCARCYDLSRKPIANPLEDPELGQTMRGYLRYLAGRQQRLARAGASE